MLRVERCKGGKRLEDEGVELIVQLQEGDEMGMLAVAQAQAGEGEDADRSDVVGSRDAREQEGGEEEERVVVQQVKDAREGALQDVAGCGIEQRVHDQQPAEVGGEVDLCVGKGIHETKDLDDAARWNRVIREIIRDCQGFQTAAISFFFIFISFKKKKSC